MDYQIDPETDPYRPDATVEERADHIIGVLLMDEDPVRRWHTIKALDGGRLRDAAAICLRQLRDQLGSTEAAAAAVGITRQGVNDLLVKADAPGAREDKKVPSQPTYWYGEYLAAIHHLAESIPDDKAREQAIARWQTLEPRAVQSLLVMPTLAELAQTWLKAIRARFGRPNVAEARSRVLDDRGGRIADWVSGRSDFRLSVKEQSEVYLGYHAARVAVRKAADA